MIALSLLAQQTQQTTAASGGGDDVTLLIAIFLLVAAVGLFIVELFIPSGGVLGMLSAGCLVAGVVMLSVVNLTWGLVVGLIAVCAVPFAVGFALSIWPQTPIGRWLTLRESQEPVVKQSEAAMADPRIGKTGQALTDLRPIGTCLIDDRREPCAAASGLIDRGQAVRVVGFDGMQLRVEKV